MIRFSLRLAEDLHRRIVQAAAADQRSIHGEIVWLLTQALDARDKRASR